ncbi:MAG: hypothetical protein FWC20_02075 [Oscillospiraceae bacterium]|nr:hypothetical protein [Oscillospiraceae bacterium]MCL2278180.1 hypothetical protein [Oscillospiraceae bacterium]
MTRSKKLYILLIVAAALTVFLTGCIRIDVSIGIEDDYTSYLTYEITIEIDEHDAEYEAQLRNALNQIGWHYQEELGFSASIHTDYPPFTLALTRRVQNNSLEQAFSSLEEMLTDETMSIFMQVDIAFERFYRQDRYLFGAMVDIPQIMRLSSIGEMTSELTERLNRAVADGDGLISISLPASESIETTHPVSITDKRAETLILMDFTEQTAFEIEARINYLRDGTVGPALDEIIEQQQQMSNIAVIISGVALLLMLITLIAAIVRAVRMRRD